MRRSRWLLLVLLASAAWPAWVSGQRRSSSRGQIIRIDALTVEGKIQKPEAFYILQRSELNFKGLEPKKSFVPLILKSVEKDPF